MATHAQHTASLVSHAHEIALKAEKIGRLASKIEFAIALNDVPKRDEIDSVTIGLDPTIPKGGPAELLTVTGTDGIQYRDFDELFDLVSEHVFLNGPGAPANLVTKGATVTFNVQALIAQIPTLTNELQDMVDAFNTFVTTA